jgi:hypothetical protein
MNSDNDNARDSGDAATIFIIIGQVSQEKGGDMAPVHVLLAAPDDDTAVRLCLDALSAKGFAEKAAPKGGLFCLSEKRRRAYSAGDGSSLAMSVSIGAAVSAPEVLRRSSRIRSSRDVAIRRIWVMVPPVPAGTRRPTMTFSLSPCRVSILPATAASVSTLVVSWNDAAEMNDGVCSDALVIPSRTGVPTAGLRPSSTRRSFALSSSI